MKTVIEMAREAGFSSLELEFRDGERLERFAALVREDAIDKFNRQINQACEEARLLDKQEISDKQGSFTEKNLSPVVCEHTNQSVTHYSNETWIQHCESCGVVIKSGTYINENGAVTNEVTTQQEPVAWTHSCNALCVDGLELWVDQCPHCGKPRTAFTPPTAALAARQIAAEIADFCSDIDGGENMFSRAIRKKYGVG